MSVIWNKISNLAVNIERRFQETGTPKSEHEQDYNWYNRIYTSTSYRRAHIEIVDNRDTHKIYILHCTIFPHYNDPSPIWGFDAVCGPNKITGAFHDFSPAGEPRHEMMKWFFHKTGSLAWSRPRELPEWARQIFSPWMIAAGNVQEEAEVNLLCDIALDTLDYYLGNVGLTQESGSDYHMAQDRYCRYQKQNPHVINSMVSMGVPREQMTEFVNKVLFPESHI